MKIDCEICFDCLKKNFYTKDGKIYFCGYSMFFDGKKTHFFAVFKADIMNYGRTKECEIMVENGESLARRIAPDRTFKHLFKIVSVPQEFNQEIEESMSMPHTCFFYDTYLVQSLNA